MTGEHLCPPGDLVVVRDERAALAAREILRSVEGVGDRAARMMADQLALVARLHGVRGILAEEQAVRVAQRADGGKIARQAGIVHRHDRARAGGDLLFDLRGIDQAGVRVDVRKDGRGAHMQNGVGRRGKRQRGGDHLVARADARRQQRKVLRRRAGIDRNAVLGAHILGELLLKLHGLGALGPPARTDDLRVRVDLSLRDIRQTEGQPVFSDRKIAHCPDPPARKAGLCLHVRCDSPACRPPCAAPRYRRFGILRIIAQESMRFKKNAASARGRAHPPEKRANLGLDNSSPGRYNALKQQTV